MDALRIKNALAFQALLTSAAIHFLSAGLFVFTFADLPDSFKPQFFFLGSILPQGDTSSLVHFQNSAPVFAVDEISLFDTNPLSQNPLRHLDNGKPLAEFKPIKDKKKVPKSTFELPALYTNQDSNSNSLDIGIGLEDFHYQPLRLRRR